MAPQNAKEGIYLRRPRPRRTDPTSNNTPTVYQDTVFDTVFAIPELLGLITNYLTREDLRTLIRVCRTWNIYWIPYLYSNLRLSKYKRSRVYPKLEVYGPHVKTLRIFYTTRNNIIHILDYATNIQSLHLQNDLAKPQLSQIIAMELVWELKDRTAVRIDDILFVIKSCRKLATLSLNCISIVEELQDINSTVEPEEYPDDMIKVDESGWESTSLKSLLCTHVLIGHPNSSHDGQMHVHPCIRLLFQHTPNLTSIEFSGRSNLCAADWEHIFENRSRLQRAEFWIPPTSRFFHPDNSFLLKPFPSMEALCALEKSCHMLKVLNVGNIRPTTDQAFEKVIKVNHQLEKINAKYTEFGELALKELTRLPVTPALPHSLVELDLEGCIQVKSSGIAMVLENCERLRVLNLSGTDAGTIDLFRGNKPWVCAKSLKKLRINIQPLNHQTLRNNSGWSEAVIINNTAPYTEEEENMIRDRLRCFTSLLELDLKGRAMSIGIMDDVSFAPRLRNVVLNAPFRSQLDGDQTRSSHYRDARDQAKKWGQEIFPNWSVWANATYRGDLIWVIQAIRD
ncbi:hypothetical protein BGX26_008285 [Mortierella sp. AD094]|nr:hypothetical protein BGX26_008285 [Mortierella sp. AD094]